MTFSRSVKQILAELTMTSNTHILVLESNFRNPSVLKAVTTNGKKLIKLGLLPKVNLSSKVLLFWNCGLCKLLLKQSNSLRSSLIYWNPSKNPGHLLVKLNRKQQLLLEQREKKKSLLKKRSKGGGEEEEKESNQMMETEMCLLLP